MQNDGVPINFFVNRQYFIVEGATKIAVKDKVVRICSDYTKECGAIGGNVF